MIEPTIKTAHGSQDGVSVKAIGTLHESAAPVFVYESVLEEILDYSHRDLTREVGGYLVGDLCTDQSRPYVEVTNFCPVKGKSQAANFTFTREASSAAQRDIATRFPDKRMVGWHHTHPGIGIFLSGYDLFIHRNFFSEWWHVAIVVDPKRQELGFFQWVEEEIDLCGFICVYGK